VLGESVTRGYVNRRVVDPLLVGDDTAPYMFATKGEVITPLNVTMPVCGKPLVTSLHPPVVGDTPLVFDACI
jgi:hypothetical protein